MNIFKYLQILALGFTASALDVKKGEWDFEVYEGPLDPRLVIDYQNDKQEFLDEVTGRTYFSVMLEPAIFDLTQEFDRYIYPNFACSKHEMTENIEYMRYLVRLTSIASLYEFYRQSSIALYQLGDEKSCALSYDAIFKSCKPKSKDMKLFTKRVSDYFPDIVDWGKYPIKLQTDRRFDLANYHPTLVKILSSHFGGDSKTSIINSCQFVKSEIQSLCSEEDSYLSALNVEEIKKEILTTSAYKIINASGKGESCFSRYEEMTKDQVSIDKKSAEIIRTALKGEDDLKVFWFGSLREFDEKGITLVEEKVVKEEPKIVAKVEVKEPKVIKTVDIKTIKIIRKPKPEPKKPEPVKEIVFSAFETAVLNYEKSKKQTEVAMPSFKDDYKFSKKTLERFNGSLRSYQTRKQLSKMKRVDNLGSLQAPMSLTFIKYLIDYNLHQGLYNMTSILGNEFFVINDLEGRTRPIKIVLDNNEETKFRWKIWVTQAE
ncbi:MULTISPECIES: hypothetical protein [unclassified Halobacteriovorax]|uniref:hypothetical protein n=1 Tax=unclassified Halobacteriovorax TaxID=2639665 RepID=UPI00399A5047